MTADMHRVAATPALQVKGLRTDFGMDHSAVEDVSFAVAPGEILGIVGESGSGKSVTGLSIMGLIGPPGRVTRGSILLDGREIASLDERSMRRIRGAEVAMIFQDPMTSLHPLLRIGEQMVDSIFAHRRIGRKAAMDEAEAALKRVGIPSPRDRLKAYPHQLSGGMRQRVAIAIALLNRPKVIIADEPTTALDVTTQSQILLEMRDLCKASGTALIWVSHDLAVVAELADKIAVMYAGSIVELGQTDQILDDPAHPYTLGLLSSVPSRNSGQKRLRQIRGSVASAFDVPGCRFAPRCDHATAACATFPSLRASPDGHAVRCNHPQSGLPETARRAST
ncbi:ABC transporter ATP-binding protein [Roseovarius sp.]|uniref:ABC transporter ATP-binding protein n=1 Tax=Roseovarius sp. TaxID=1486281 RepID=UPI003B5AB55A